MWPCLYFALCSCSSYDPSLLVAPDVAAPLPMPDAGGTGGHQLADAGPVDSGRPVPRCGDGLLNGDERATSRSPPDKPGACPTECVAAAECAPRAVSGSSVQCRMRRLAADVQDRRRLLLGQLHRRQRRRLLDSCGDGIVQSDKGETAIRVRPTAMMAAAVHRARRSPTATTTRRARWTCCSAASRTATRIVRTSRSSNPRAVTVAARPTPTPMRHGLPAVCGNKIKEGAEQCDSTHGLQQRLQATMTPDQMACMDSCRPDANDCDLCSCMQCATQQLTVVASGDASRDAHCTEILACSNQHDCVRTACYCADPNDLIGCGLGAAGRAGRKSTTPQRPRVPARA